MGRIPAAELERLKSEVDLAELVRAKGVELKKHGDNLLGRCPFHNDRTPSLVVTPKKNLWHCMGACQVGGSVIDWVMKAECVSFRHAVELLRSGDAAALLSAGPTLKTGSTVPRLASPVDFNTDDQTLLTQVLNYYHQRLKVTPAALEYLESRGINDNEAIVKFHLGFADRTLGLRLPPATRVAGTALRDRLMALGVHRANGREHFNGAIVFPIVSVDGKVTEIYGRKIIDSRRPEAPRHCYLPGPHRGVWNPEGVKFTDVILCEAIIDALSFWVNGFKNVTASFGTEGFTAGILQSFIDGGVKRVFIAYDHDEAGAKAAEKVTARLNEKGIEAHRVLFPKGMDANEYACKMRPARKALELCLESAERMGKAFAPAEAHPAPSLVAAAETALRSMCATEPAPTPATTPAAPVEVPAEMRGEDLFITLDTREYRVRGLSKNLSYDVMRVNIKAAEGVSYHVDTLDLYQAKARTAFINAVADELGASPEAIKQDLGRVLFKCEELQEDQIRRTLGGATKKQEVEVKSEERELALHLLRAPDLLKRILTDFEACGVVGEETNKLVGYLAAVSRKLEDPLAVIIQSSSAAGKSSLMEAVLAMVPEEDRVKYSAMTGQSLFYMGETDLKHRILAIAEEQGAHLASYALKLLQSEGEISIASTGKDAATGKMVTHKYRVEGPVMIMLTTTAIEIDEELLNRCLVLTVNEDRTQTRAIHALQRERQTLEGLLARQEKTHLLKLHQNAQRLLRPLLVVNPFAKQLTFLDSRTRMRRDHIKYLTLIRAIALLHQYQREVKTIEHRGRTVEYIEVTPQDIATANELCHEILGRSLDELSPQTRRLLIVLNSMVAESCAKENIKRSDVSFTRKQVREYCGWSDFQVRMHIDKLAAMEYVLAHRGGRGSSFVYELLYDGGGADGRPAMMGLIDSKTLTSNIGAARQICNYDTKFEHQKGQFEGSTSIQRAPIEHGSRSPETKDCGGVTDETGETKEKRRIRGPGR